MITIVLKWEYLLAIPILLLAGYSLSFVVLAYYAWRGTQLDNDGDLFFSSFAMWPFIAMGAIAGSPALLLVLSEDRIKISRLVIVPATLFGKFFRFEWMGSLFKGRRKRNIAKQIHKALEQQKQLLENPVFGQTPAFERLPNENEVREYIKNKFEAALREKREKEIAASLDRMDKQLAQIVEEHEPEFKTQHHGVETNETDRRKRRAEKRRKRKLGGQAFNG